MSKKAFDRIAEGLGEAISIARGDAEPARVDDPAAIDVRALRTALHLSQEDFALRFGFSLHQIRQWEQGRARPLGAVRAYLMIIERDPDQVLALLHRASAGRSANEAA